MTVTLDQQPLNETPCIHLIAITITTTTTTTITTTIIIIINLIHVFLSSSSASPVMSASHSVHRLFLRRLSLPSSPFSPLSKIHPLSLPSCPHSPWLGQTGQTHFILSTNPSTSLSLSDHCSIHLLFTTLPPYFPFFLVPNSFPH